MNPMNPLRPSSSSLPQVAGPGDPTQKLPDLGGEDEGPVSLRGTGAEAIRRLEELSCTVHELSALVNVSEEQGLVETVRNLMAEVASLREEKGVLAERVQAFGENCQALLGFRDLDQVAPELLKHPLYPATLLQEAVQTHAKHVAPIYAMRDTALAKALAALVPGERRDADYLAEFKLSDSYFSDPELGSPSLQFEAFVQDHPALKRLGALDASVRDKFEWVVSAAQDVDPFPLDTDMAFGFEKEYGTVHHWWELDYTQPDHNEGALQLTLFAREIYRQQVSERLNAVVGSLHPDRDRPVRVGAYGVGDRILYRNPGMTTDREDVIVGFGNPVPLTDGRLSTVPVFTKGVSSYIPFEWIQEKL